VRRLRLLWRAGGRLGSAGRATTSSGCRPPRCPHGAAGLAAHSRTGPGGGVHCPGVRETATWLLFLSAFRPVSPCRLLFRSLSLDPSFMSRRFCCTPIHKQTVLYLAHPCLVCLQFLCACLPQLLCEPIAQQGGREESGSSPGGLRQPAAPGAHPGYSGGERLINTFRSRQEPAARYSTSSTIWLPFLPERPHNVS
jgi:hypothetical protein